MARTYPILTVMRLHNIPETRENYILLAFGAQPDGELHPELEAELPWQFRREALDDADEENPQ
jgi:hypothetical protein